MGVVWVNHFVKQYDIKLFVSLTNSEAMVSRRRCQREVLQGRSN